MRVRGAAARICLTRVVTSSLVNDPKHSVLGSLKPACQAPTLWLMHDMIGSIIAMASSASIQCLSSSASARTLTALGNDGIAFRVSPAQGSPDLLKDTSWTGRNSLLTHFG